MAATVRWRKGRQRAAPLLHLSARASSHCDAGELFRQAAKQAPKLESGATLLLEPGAQRGSSKEPQHDGK